MSFIEVPLYRQYCSHNMYICAVSWLTQVFVELHGTNMAASNEALCLEILGKIGAVTVCFVVMRIVLMRICTYCTCCLCTVHVRTYIHYHPYFNVLRCVRILQLCTKF